MAISGSWVAAAPTCAGAFAISINAASREAGLMRVSARRRHASSWRGSLCFVSLPDRNEKARLRMRPLRSALNSSREVHSEVFISRENNRVCRPAMMPILSKNKKGRNMLKKLLAASAMAAIAYAVVPANAAKVGAGCSGANLTKTETMIENMADGEGKITAQKEIAAAQDAMLNGKMGACASHLNKAMHVGMVK